MSGQIAEIPLLANPPPNPLGFQSQLAQLIGQRQAAIQAEQATQMGALGVARQRYGLDMVPGFSSYLQGVPGAPPPVGQGGGAPAGVLGGLGATAPPGAPAGSLPAGRAAAPGQPAASEDPYQLGPQTANTMYGIPLPPLQAVAVFSSKDPDAALKQAEDARRQNIYEVASTMPWETAVRTLYGQGYFDRDRATQLLSTPQDKRGMLIQAMSSPDAYSSLRAAGYRVGVTPGPGGPGDEQISPQVVAAAGAKSGAETLARAGVEGIPANEPRVFPGAGAPAARAADLFDTTKPLTGPQYAGLVQGAENAGGPPNARATTSSATGNGQFIDQTWLDLVNKHAPQLAQGKTQSQILALRSDPNTAAQMSVAYAQDNAPALQAAGMPVNSGTLGMAHRFGPAGAIAVMGAAPDTPIAKVVTPEVMAANPDLAGKTVGTVSRQMMQQYGTRPVQLAAPSAGPEAGGAGAQPMVNFLPGPGGTTIMQPNKGVAAAQEAAARVPTQVEVGQEADDRKLADEAQTAADHGIVGKAQALQARDALAGQGTGAAGNWRASLGSYLETLMPGNTGQQASKAILGMDPEKAQEGAKYALQQVTSFERESNPRGGFNITRMMTGALPGLETLPNPLRHMTNFIAVGHQLETDANQGATQFYQDQSNALKSGAGYQPMATFYKHFNDQYPAEVGIAAGKALSGDPYAEWSKGLIRGDHAATDQIARVLQLAWRTDPAARIMWSDGKMKANAATQPVPAAPAAPPVTAATPAVTAATPAVAAATPTAAAAAP